MNHKATTPKPSKDEEEGFIEEKELNSLLGESTTLKQHFFEEERWRNGYLNRLPEANPLLDINKQVKLTPKEHPKYVLLEGQLFSQRDKFGSLQKDNNILYQEQKLQTLQLQQQEQQSQRPLLQKEQLPKEKQIIELLNRGSPIYEKYAGKSSEYRLVYNLFNEGERTEQETKRNFTGIIINLSISLKQNEPNPLSKVRDKHLHKDLTKGIKSEKESKVQQHGINRMPEDALFESKFESGNLLYAFKKKDEKQNTYDLIISNDINSKGYAQWFFFQVSNVQKGKLIHINIVNHTKRNCLFMKGMKPAVFSLQENLHSDIKPGWRRAGSGVRYYENSIQREVKESNYYTLSFSYMFEFDDDTVSFAMAYPYTFTDLNNHLNKIVENNQNMYIKKEVLCTSIAGNGVHLLTVTSKEGEKTQKKVAFILARQHPGETVSSFLMQGFIDYIVSDSKEAIFLRSQYIFKIIPIVNPDGVILGNFRCNLSGVDLNRQWSNPNKILHPCVYGIKKLLRQYLRNGFDIDYFIDLHGHSKKLNSFIYACRIEDDETACCIFPMMLSKLNPICHYPSCTFGLSSYKENTARGIAWNCGIKKPNIFTVETSFFGHGVQYSSSQHFSISDLNRLGSDIAKCIFLYKIEENNSQFKELEDVMKDYQSAMKSSICTEIGKNKGAYLRGHDQDSGSDSDPQIDELCERDKIKEVIGTQIAKDLGMINSEKKGKIIKMKRKSIDLKQPQSNLISIQQQQSPLKHREKKVPMRSNFKTQTACEEKEERQVRISPLAGFSAGYPTKIRNIEREAYKDLEFKKEKQEIAKKHFRMANLSSNNPPPLQFPNQIKITLNQVPSTVKTIPTLETEESLTSDVKLIQQDSISIYPQNSLLEQGRENSVPFEPIKITNKSIIEDGGAERSQTMKQACCKNTSGIATSTSSSAIGGQDSSPSNHFILFPSNLDYKDQYSLLSKREDKRKSDAIYYKSNNNSIHVNSALLAIGKSQKIYYEQKIQNESLKRKILQQKSKDQQLAIQREKIAILQQQQSQISQMQQQQYLIPFSSKQHKKINLMTDTSNASNNNIIKYKFNNELITTFSKIVKENVKKYKCEPKILHITRSHNAHSSHSQSSAKRLSIQDSDPIQSSIPDNIFAEHYQQQQQMYQQYKDSRIMNQFKADKYRESAYLEEQLYQSDSDQILLNNQQINRISMIASGGTKPPPLLQILLNQQEKKNSSQNNSQHLESANNAKVLPKQLQQFQQESPVTSGFRSYSRQKNQEKIILSDRTSAASLYQSANIVSHVSNCNFKKKNSSLHQSASPPHNSGQTLQDSVKISNTSFYDQSSGYKTLQCQPSSFQNYNLNKVWKEPSSSSQKIIQGNSNEAMNGISPQKISSSRLLNL